MTSIEPVCFCDIDGVLANFTQGALRVHGFDLRFLDHEMDWGFTPAVRLGMPAVTTPEFWADMGRAFWADLEWTREGYELLTGIEKIFGPHNVCLLSSPCDTDGCRDGKMDWVRKHLPQYEKRTLLGQVKYHLAAPSKVLVDDYDGNIDKWILAGGQGIRVPRAWNARSQDLGRDGTFDVASLIWEIRETHKRMIGK